MKESRIEIILPALDEADVKADQASRAALVGILRHDDQGPPRSTSAPRPIALILHGVLAHKDQLFHRQLASELPINSFRFDFRHAAAGGESRETKGGPAWDMANFADDVIDMHVVIKYLRKTFNYHVEAIISHSRGTLDSWTYFWDVEQRRRGVISNRRDDFILDRVPLFVAIAGRWDMTRMRKRSSVYGQQFREKGSYDWNVRVAGKPVSVQILPDMVERFATFPIQDMVRSFPAECDVLVIHGDKDPTIPVDDAFEFKNHLETRQLGIYARQGRPSSTELLIVPGADHTFKGHFDAVVKRSCSWLKERRDLASAKMPEASPEEQAFLQRVAPRGDANASALSSWSSEGTLNEAHASTTSSSKL